MIRGRLIDRIQQADIKARLMQGEPGIHSLRVAEIRNIRSVFSGAIDYLSLERDEDLDELIEDVEIARSRIDDLMEHPESVGNHSFELEKENA